MSLMEFNTVVMESEESVKSIAPTFSIAKVIPKLDSSWYLLDRGATHSHSVSFVKTGKGVPTSAKKVKVSLAIGTAQAFYDGRTVYVVR